MPPSNTRDAAILGGEQIPSINTFKYRCSVVAAEAKCMRRLHEYGSTVLEQMK